MKDSHSSRPIHGAIIHVKFCKMAEPSVISAIWSAGVIVNSNLTPHAGTPTISSLEYSARSSLAEEANRQHCLSEACPKQVPPADERDRASRADAV
jgi:hypothetical protein